MAIKQLNLGEIYGRASQVRNAEMLNRLNEMKMRDYDRTIRERDEKRNILARHYSPATTTQGPMPQGQTPYTGGGGFDAYNINPVTRTPDKMDYGGAQAEMMGKGYMAEGTELGKFVLDEVKADRDAKKWTVDYSKAVQDLDKGKREIAAKNVQMIGSGMGAVMEEYNSYLAKGANPQEASQAVNGTYQKVLSLLQGQDVDISKIPPVFDPTAAKTAMNLALSVKEQATLTAAKAKAVAAKDKYKSPDAIRTRISAIGQAIQRIEKGGEQDKILMALMPELAGAETPESQEEAISLLRSEMETLKAKLPKEKKPKVEIDKELQGGSVEGAQGTRGGGAGTARATPKTLDQNTAAAIFKEAGGDKARAIEIAKQRGYSG